MPIPPDQQSPFGGGDALVPAPKVWAHYDVTNVTLWRWIRTGIFPPPDKIICGRRYWRTSTIDAFDREAA